MSSNLSREERFRALYSHETIYMPPFEAESTALEVCLGCSWAKCRFCDFARDEFRVNSDERIDHDLQELSEIDPECTRMFFLGENTFCLPAGKLIEIMEKAKRALPKITGFAMYARVDDITRKTEEELRQLREAGLDTLHIGVESGCNDVLDYVNKGITAQDTIRETRRLDAAGIFYHVTVVLGLGGKSYSRFHALETARLINQIKAVGVWCLKLHLFEGTPLFREEKMGTFDMMTPYEILREEYIMLKNITAEIYFADTTVLDTYSLVGMLPDTKDQLLSSMARLLATEGQ